jgi:pimeloyl-ACP methyl ester carboxylesterase
MEPRSRFVPGADGLRLHALEWSREGLPFVLLHGFGNEAHFWDELAQVVAPYYRTLAFDLRGHGDSDSDPEAGYDHVSMARDIEAAIEALGLERLVLLGHSMGGRVALRFAGEHPERMAGLILVDTGPDLDLRGVTRIRLESGRQALTFESTAEYEELLGQLYPSARPQTLARLASTGLRRLSDGRYERKIDPALPRRHESVSTEEWRAWADAETKVLWDALERIPCPILIIRGAASDVLSPETAERMAEASPRATLVEIERASHSVMLDNPEGLRGAVADFALTDA